MVEGLTRARQWATRLAVVVALAVSGLMMVTTRQAMADGSLNYAGWEGLGGASLGAPATTNWGPGRLDVFVRGTDTNLYHQWYFGAWSSWENLGSPPGGLSSDPTAVAWAPGRIDVFAAGGNGHLWHKWYAAGWSWWEDLGGFMVGAPAVASWAPGRLDVFIRGTDDQLWHIWYAGGWAGWEPLGGVLTSAPAAASWGPGRIDVAFRGSDNAAWHTAYAGFWIGFDSLGGVLSGAPGLSTWAPGRLDLYAWGTDNQLYHQWFGGVWSGWQFAMPGTLASAPAATSWGPYRSDVFVRGTDGAIYHSWADIPAVPCATSQLAASVRQGQGGAGTLYFPVDLTNISSTACYLSGYPGVSFVDGVGNQLGAPASQSPLQPGWDVEAVPLNPGGKAVAVLWYSQPGFYDPAVCQPATAAGLRVYPPGQTAALFAPSTQTVCANPSFVGWSHISQMASPTITF